MPSAKRFRAESLLREAERDFAVARTSVKAAAASYERCRDLSPGSDWAGKAHRAWFLGVSDWIYKALALEEALEAVMLLDREGDTGMLPPGPTSAEQVNLAAVDALPGFDPKDQLRAPASDAPEPEPALQKRLKRTNDNFTTATEALKQARQLADAAYRTYRGNRTTASADDLGQMREAWRKTLVVWSFALRDREVARDKALATMKRAGQLSTDPTQVGTIFSSNISDPPPDPEELL
ncbi:hypothetical protein ACFOY4_40850 [Actinomadura syzygii]|uniref:Uncharacterized protein n=1 Tax=Actinomadura syzygii TaxID=1427538 RepID=A0A5D0U9K3_9ACTN|nr:hypothetical protein [Actinomadura syzygii]TYC14684.1 hypothetical protein FXF65_17830 [Actinomadura syzygii]